MTNSVVTKALNHATINAQIKEAKMKFSEKLKKLRKDNNLTQDELAEKLFVTRTAVSKWETDKGFPGIDSLKLLSNIFNVSIDELISDNDVDNKRLLDEKFARKMYLVAIGFLAITFTFTLLTYFLANTLYIIGIYVGVIGYLVFGLLSKPKYKRLSAKKLIIPYVLTRLVLLIIIVVTMVTTIIQLT